MATDLGPWLNTRWGRRFFLLHPEKSTIYPADIAWSLSMLARFNGGLKEFYSVAQHCVMVSHKVPPEHALAGLLHDAAEAYLGDVTSPLKEILDGKYRSLEQRVAVQIFKRFGVPWPPDPSVKEADLRAVATEIRDLGPPGPYWKPGTTPYEGGIVTWTQPKAYRMWMRRFNALATHASMLS